MRCSPPPIDNWSLCPQRMGEGLVLLEPLSEKFKQDIAYDGRNQCDPKIL
jgi:hypothetical protein